MDQKTQEEHVKKHFDREAKGYDTSAIVESYQRRTQDLVLKQIQIRKGMNVLDLGCGTGWATFKIASGLEGSGNVVGLDLSEKMIEQARQKLSQFPYKNLEFNVGTGNDLAAYPNFFDYVLSTNAFHHFGDKTRIFSEVWKSLKPQGRFILQDFCDDYFWIKILDFFGKIGEKAHVGSTTLENLKDIFFSANFSDVKVERQKLTWFWGIMIGEGKKPD